MALKKYSLINVLLLLLGFSTLFPAFAQYLFSFLLLLMVVSGRWWREIPVIAHVKPLHRSIGAYVALMILAGLVAGAFGPYVQGFAEAVRAPLHLAMKSWLVWVVLYCGFIYASQQGDIWRGLFIGWVILFSANFIYLLVQRYTGIDLSHGLGATLPPNRFAYGVYRVSGFMGHPLSLSFSLVTLLTTLVGLRLDPNVLWTKTESRLLTALAGIVGVSLLVTGSRWPILVVIGSLVLVEGRKLRRWVKELGLGALALGAFLLWEKSIVGRFSEVLQGNMPMEERFERLVFWKVHWKMFLDYPWYGVGMGASPEAKLHYYNALGYNGNIYNAHNVFLQTLADSGLIGFFGLLIFLVGLGQMIRRMRDRGGVVALRYVFVSLLLGGLMQNTLRDTEVVFSVWLCLAMILAVSASKSVNMNSKTNQRDDGREPTQNI